MTLVHDTIIVRRVLDASIGDAFRAWRKPTSSKHGVIPAMPTGPAASKPMTLSSGA